MDPVRKPYESPYSRYQRIKVFVEKNSKPKQLPVQPEIKRGPLFNDMAKINEMAKPIVRKQIPVFIGVVPTALEAIATPRIEELAKPTERQMYRKPMEHKIRVSTLCYQATPAIEALSQPKVPYRKPRVVPLVKQSALNAKASERVKQLAEPLKRDVPPKEFVFTINPVALTYRPTMQIRKLAKPHKPFTMQDIMEREVKRLARKALLDEKRAKREQRRKEATMKRHELQRKHQGL